MQDVQIESICKQNLNVVQMMKCVCDGRFNLYEVK